MFVVVRVWVRQHAMWLCAKMTHLLAVTVKMTHLWTGSYLCVRLCCVCMCVICE